MKHLLRIIFETHKKTFLQFAVEDLFSSIPKKVSDPGITVFTDQRSKMERWFMWMAYLLQRRMVDNPLEAEKIHGMLLQIKIMLTMIGGAPATTEATEGVSSAAKAQADRQKREADDLEKGLKGVADFMNPPKPPIEE